MRPPGSSGLHIQCQEQRAGTGENAGARGKCAPWRGGKRSFGTSARVKARGTCCSEGGHQRCVVHFLNDKDLSTNVGPMYAEGIWMSAQDFGKDLP